MHRTTSLWGWSPVQGTKLVMSAYGYPPANGFVLQSLKSGKRTECRVRPTKSTRNSRVVVVTPRLRNSTVKITVWKNAIERKPITQTDQRTRIAFVLDFTALGMPLIDVVRQNCFAFSILSERPIKLAKIGKATSYFIIWFLWNFTFTK